jgi:hypothetical protein
MARGFEQVWLAGRHTTEGLARTDFGDGTLIAIQTTVMPHLHEQRAVAESRATFDAFGAANTQVLINHVLVIRVLDVGPLDGCDRT